MKQDIIILQTAKVSLVIQIVAAIVGIYGITLQLPLQHIILREVLVLETVVQCIELIYYLWLINQFANINYNVTSTRYFDWVLSTPIMFITTAIFMTYRNHLGDSSTLSLFSFLRENANDLFQIVGANAIMLLFGYLGEIEIISRFQGFFWGSLFFIISFLLLFSHFVGDDGLNQQLFWFMAIIWGFYGVAYCLNYKTKNVMYNFLDIFSKNFYGFFLFYYIYQISRETPSS